MKKFCYKESVKNLILIFTFLISNIAFAKGTLQFDMMVRRASDGDTIAVKDQDGRNERIRLLGVDTPETNFQGSSQGHHAKLAKAFMSKVAPVGTKLKVYADKSNPYDKNGRILGVVYIGDLNLNEEILKRGLGLPYFIDPQDDDLLKSYADLCHEAEASQNGIFDSQNPLKTAPYTFRAQVSKRPAINIVGDIAVKEFVSPNQFKSIHPCDRVFFSSENGALNFGYKKSRP